MTQVAKYNLYKAISTVLTVGTPIATLACCGDLFVHRTDTAISAAGVFAFLLSLLFIKDKLLEFMKTPTALKVAIIGLVFCIIADKLILTLKIVFIATIIASSVDELTFKRFYKKLLISMPQGYQEFEHFGFIWCKNSTLLVKAQEVKDEQTS